MESALIRCACAVVATKQQLVMPAAITTARTFSTEFSQTWRCDHSKAEYFIFVLDNSHQNPCAGSKDMINFVKCSTKYVKPLLTLDLPWSCAIKDYSSRRESILSLYKPNLHARGKPSTMVTARKASRDCWLLCDVQKHNKIQSIQKGMHHVQWHACTTISTHGM